MLPLSLSPSLTLAHTLSSSLSCALFALFHHTLCQSICLLCAFKCTFCPKQLVTLVCCPRLWRPSIHPPPPALTWCCCCCLCGSLDLHWLPITVLVLAESQMPSRPLRKGCVGKVGRAGRLEGRLAVCVKSMLAQHFIGQWPTLAKQLNSLFLPLSLEGGGAHGAYECVVQFIYTCKAMHIDFLLFCLITYCISFECLTNRKKSADRARGRGRAKEWGNCYVYVIWQLQSIRQI